MKDTRFYLMIAAFLLFLVSCRTVAHIEKDETVDFGKFKTFTWAEIPAEEQGLSDIQARNLQSAVSEALKKNAQWQESSSRPDVILKHDIQVDKVVRQYNEPVYSQAFSRNYYNPYTRRWVNIYYPPRFLGYDRDQVQANEATFTISMIDASTNRVIWQGWTTADVNRKLTSREIQEGVKAIFKNFSP